MKKRFLSILLMLFVVIALLPIGSISASATTVEGIFTQCTGAITSGYYVFGVGGSAASISAVNNTVGTIWIKFTTATSTGGTITNPDSSIVWYYDANAGTFKNGDNYIYWPTTGNAGGVGTKNTPLTVTKTATSGVYNITVTATPGRMLRLNGTNGYRFYTSTTGTDTFYFFKLKDEQSSSTQITQHSVAGKANNAGAGYEYNYAFTMTSFEAINGTFIVALYDGQNKLVGVKTILLSNDKSEHTETNTEPILTSSKAATYKIMFWSGLDSLRPLCKAESGYVEYVD